MIYPKTVVAWLHLDKMLNEEGSIGTLFHQFIEYSEYTRYKEDAKISYTNLVDFEKFGINVVIRDWFGWTKLKRIKKIATRENLEWQLLKFFNIETRVTADTPMLVHVDIDNPAIGFHGIERFNQKIIPFKEIEKNQFLRIRDIECEENEFFEVVPTKLDLVECNEYFVIETRSSTFNADSILSPAVFS